MHPRFDFRYTRYPSYPSSGSHGCKVRRPRTFPSHVKGKSVFANRDLELYAVISNRFCCGAAFTFSTSPLRRTEQG